MKMPRVLTDKEWQDMNRRALQGLAESPLAREMRADLDAIAQRRLGKPKPHISRWDNGGPGWRCRGDGWDILGHTPADAYRKWLAKVTHTTFVGSHVTREGVVFAHV